MSFVYVGENHKTDTKETGLNEMYALFNKMEDRLFYTRPDVHVGSFGIKSDDGIVHAIKWRVSGARKDRRHGYVGEQVPHCRHTKELLDSMFKGWK